MTTRQTVCYVTKEKRQSTHPLKIQLEKKKIVLSHISNQHHEHGPDDKVITIVSRFITNLQKQYQVKLCL